MIKVLQIGCSINPGGVENIVFNYFLTIYKFVIYKNGDALQHLHLKLIPYTQILNYLHHTLSCIPNFS